MSKQNEIDIRAAVKAHIAKKYGTQEVAAKEWDVSGSYVSSVLKGHKAMPESMALEAGFKIVKHESTWVRIRKRAGTKKVEE